VLSPHQGALPPNMSLSMICHSADLPPVTYGSNVPTRLVAPKHAHEVLVHRHHRHVGGVDGIKLRLETMFFRCDPGCGFSLVLVDRGGERIEVDEAESKGIVAFVVARVLSRLRGTVLSGRDPGERQGRATSLVRRFLPRIIRAAKRASFPRLTTRSLALENPPLRQTYST